MKQLRSTIQDLRRLFEKITVRYVAEFDLQTALPIEDGLAVQKTMAELDIDVFPVIEGGEVLGFLLQTDLGSGSCQEQMKDVTPDLLIAESTPLLQMFQLLRDHRWRFVLEGNKITGIVTQGDLRKEPVRMFLFALINMLEMQLARLIQKYQPDNKWTSKLSSDRLKKAESLFKKRKDKNEAIGLIECLQLCDKKAISLKIPKIKKIVLSSSKNKANSFFKRTENLRDRIAHANDLIKGSTWVELCDICEDLQAIVLRCEKVK